MTKDFIERRIEFRNGWTIDVHEIKNGEVLFRRWPPGVERQSFVQNLSRMAVDEFERQVRDAEAA